MSLIAARLEGCRGLRHEMTAWCVEGAAASRNEASAKFAFIAF